MTSSQTTTPDQSQQARSTLADDIHAVYRFVVNGLDNPTELWTSSAPSLSELTFGLVGYSFSPERDIGDLSGKVILVTGGNAGLGKETVLQLARHNPARIYLAARTESKALDAIKSIQDELSTSSSLPSTVDIQYIPLDLTSLSSIKEAAEHFNRNNSRLDILVLNAGVMAEPATTTPDGYEIQFGTNHVGHSLLTKLLLPTLLETTKNQPDADVRVVSVSSAANCIAPANHDLYEAMTSTEKLLRLTTWQRYGISKAANILFASELARRYPAIKSVALHPGLVSTQLYDGTRETNQTAKYGLSVAMRLAFRSTQSGALNQLWAAAGARKDELVNGGYYTPIGLRLVHNRFSEDKELAKNLWDWTDNDISKKLGAL